MEHDKTLHIKNKKEADDFIRFRIHGNDRCDENG